MDTDDFRFKERDYQHVKCLDLLNLAKNRVEDKITELLMGLNWRNKITPIRLNRQA